MSPLSNYAHYRYGEQRLCYSFNDESIVYCLYYEDGVALCEGVCLDLVIVPSHIFQHSFISQWSIIWWYVGLVDVQVSIWMVKGSCEFVNV